MELTAEEREIIGFIQLGKKNKEIFKSMYLSETTFYRRLNNIYKKLNVKNRLNLVAIVSSNKI